MGVGGGGPCPGVGVGGSEPCPGVGVRRFLGVGGGDCFGFLFSCFLYSMIVTIRATIQAASTSVSVISSDPIEAIIDVVSTQSSTAILLSGSVEILNTIRYMYYCVGTITHLQQIVAWVESLY